jgi:hypothetical protein
LKRVGAAAVIDGLQSTFVLLRKIIGNPPQLEANEEVVVRAANPGIKRAHSASAPAIPSLSRVLNKSSSSSLLPSIHHLSVYRLPITLWLSTSSLYRKCNLFDQSLHAIQEAEKVLTMLSQIQHHIRNQDSKLFKGSKTFPQSQGASGGYWKEDDPVLASIQADLALEVYNSLILESVFTIPAIQASAH